MRRSDATRGHDTDHSTLVSSRSTRMTSRYSLKRCARAQTGSEHIRVFFSRSVIGVGFLFCVHRKLQLYQHCYRSVHIIIVFYFLVVRILCASQHALRAGHVVSACPCNRLSNGQSESLERRFRPTHNASALRRPCSHKSEQVRLTCDDRSLRAKHQREG